MDDNPYQSPQSPVQPQTRRERTLLWHLLYNPLHPISWVPPLALVLVITLAVLVTVVLR